LCRTQNGFDVNSVESYRKNIRSVIDTGKMYDDYISGALKDGRGNICPVTIILPTIAMEAKENISNKAKLSNSNEEEYDLVEEFMEKLDHKIYEAKDMLIERYKWICSQSADSATFMYENHTMYGYVPEEGIESALKHGTLALGQLGVAETLQILIDCDQTSDEGFALAERIEELFERRCNEFKEETSLNFGVYLTPEHNG